MDNFTKLFEEMDDFDVVSPEEMEVAKDLEPVVDKHGVEAILSALEAFADFTAEYHNLRDEKNVLETEPEIDKFG